MNFAKTSFKLFAGMVLMLAFAACSDDEPVQLPSEYSIPSGIVPDIPAEQIVVVSDKGGFSGIFGEDAARLSPVKFKEASLLVVRGVSNYGISGFDSHLSPDGKSLRISVRQNFTTVMQPWTAGYLVDKGLKASDVHLEVVYENYW